MAEVRVRKLRIAVAATDADMGVQALRDVETVLPHVLDQVAARLGDEVLVLRRADIHLLVRTAGGAAGLMGDLERKLGSILDSLVAEARAAASRGGESAWYASEADAFAAYVLAVARGRGDAWPFTAFRHWGATLEAIWSSGIRRGASFIADVLAVLARDSAVVAAVPATIAVQLVTVLHAGSSLRAALRVAELPLDLRRRLAELRAVLPATLTPEQIWLAELGALFAEWPPARALDIDRAELEAELHAPGQATFHASSAGGLLLWATLLPTIEELDLESNFPIPRVRGAVRWALGRTLETASLAQRDPLLLLWAGEAIDASARFAETLADADPEPLHASALAAAGRLGYLDGELRVVPLGDQQAAIGDGGLILDVVGADDVHAAVPPIVRNLKRRAAGVEPELSVENELDSATLDSIAEVDAAFAPEAWRPSLRAMASVLRRWLHDELRAELRDVRGWRAACTSDAIELRRSDVNRVDGGSWLREREISLGGTRYPIRLV